MPSAKTTRTLHMKHVHFKAGNRKDFAPPAIETLLASVQAKAKKFADRHYPPPTPKLSPDTSCAFLDNIRARSGKPENGVYFEVSAYIYGLAVEQFNPDFTKARPDISQGRITDSKGNVREILHTYHCLALGQTLLMEYDRAAGGVGMLERLLSYVFKFRVNEKLPGVGLMDVETSDLARAIKAGGGVDTVSLRALTAAGPDGEDNVPVTYRLTELGKRVKGAKHVKVLWDSGDGELDTASVLALADEYADDESGLDQMSILLKSGGTVPSLSKYRERRRIDDIRVNNQGVLNVSDIETGLGKYLDELRQLRDGWRVIDDEGNFVAPKVVSVGQ